MRTRKPGNPRKPHNMPCSRIFFPGGDSLKEKHRLLGDEDFTRAFEECTLEPNAFTHEAHIRLAWILIKEHGLDKASDMLCEQIMRFDRQHGKGTKFSEEVTLGSARLIDNLQKQSHDRTFMDFIARHPRLLFDFGELLAAYTGNLHEGKAGH